MKAHQVREPNLIICTSSGGRKVGFTALMTDAIPSLHMADVEGCHCFPMFVYSSRTPSNED